jgi:hypothetical protein
VQVTQLNKRLVDKRISVRCRYFACFAGAKVSLLTQTACSDAALDYLAEIGYDPIYGARPLQALN